MAIVVSPMGRIFRIEISHEEEKISFDFKQLDYKTKAKITKLAQGLPVGGEIESLDDGTLYSAFKNRTGIKSSSD